MADIFTGNGFTLSYNTDLSNRSPQSITSTLINEVNTFPDFQIESITNKYETYDSTYNNTLLSEKTVQPFQIVVNYIPDDVSHKFLDDAAENQTEFQLTIQYKREGTELTYAMMTGAISAFTLSGDKDVVVTKSYTFTPLEIVSRSATVTAMLPIYQSDYGVGSNGVDVPEYMPTTPTGNSFIKVPSDQAGNPLGVDMMGVGLVDGSTVSSIALTKTGTLGIYAKNATTAWTRIYTAVETDDKYVPLTRTINGHALTEDLQLDATDFGMVNLTEVTNDPQLKIASNLSDLADVEEARTNLDVYSKEEVAVLHGGYVPKTTTINGHDLSTDVVLDNNDVGLGNITNEAQLTIDNNLSDLADAATARDNLGLGTSATYNMGIGGPTVPLQSNNNVFSGINNFSGSNTRFGTLAGSDAGIEIGSITNAATAYVDFHSSGSATNDYDVRISSSGGTNGTIGQGTLTVEAGLVSLDVLALNTPLTIESGGTGANTAADARTNLAVDKIVQTSASTNINYPSKNAAFVLRDSDLTWGVYNNDTAAWQPLGIGQGGTGAITGEQALINLNAMPFRRSTLATTDNLNDFDGTNPGVYYCATNAAATDDNNYPTAQAGALLVLRNGANAVAGCTQMYMPYNNDIMYTRLCLAGTTNSWTAWKAVIKTGDYGIGITGEYKPTGVNNAFISESDGATTWAPYNAAGWQSNYATTRLMQMMISTSNDTYTRYVDSGDPKAAKTSYPWIKLLKTGDYGLGTDLALNTNFLVNLDTLATSVTGSYYTTNETTLGGVTSDTTYHFIQRGARPTAIAQKYVQQRSFNGYYMGTTGWVWREHAQLESFNTFKGRNVFTNTTGTSTGGGAIEISYGSSTPSFLIRNDGTSTYFMLTDANDSGNYNSLRPMYINNTSGAVTIGNGLGVQGTTYFNGNSTVNGSLVVQNNLTTLIKNGETMRLVSTAGQASYIMSYIDNTGATASRRWYIGNGGSTYDLNIINSQTNNAITLQAGGAIGFTSRSTSGGAGTAYSFAMGTTGQLTGPGGTYTANASDEKLKTNIEDAKSGALDRINAIQCKEFNWLGINEGRRDRGFISQQLQTVDELYTFYTDDIDIMNYSDNALMSDLFGAVQELTVLLQDKQDQIDNLTAQLEETNSIITTNNTNALGLIDVVSSSNVELQGGINDFQNQLDQLKAQVQQLLDNQ